MHSLDKIKLFSEQGCLSLLSIIRVLIFSKSCRINSKSNELNSNDQLVIIGNGPSLKNEATQNYLKNVEADLMCVNAYPKTDAFEEVKPRYFLVSACELWQEGLDEHHTNFGIELFTTLSNKTNWPLTLFIPHRAKTSKNWSRIIEPNSCISVVYYNNITAEGFNKFRNFFYDKQWGMPRPHNVLIPSIMVGIWAGYKKIVLIGADHSWLEEITVDNENTVLLRQKHFYDSDTAIPTPMRKIGKGERKLHEILHKFYHTFAGYFIIKEYSLGKQVKIINSTDGSYIDAFERRSIQPDLISKK